MDCKRIGEKDQLEEVKKKTNWKQKAGNEKPLREQRELEKCQKGMEMQQACLNKATMEPDLIEGLLVRNRLECENIAASWINME
jgi:hypothetical protein